MTGEQVYALHSQLMERFNVFFQKLERGSSSASAARRDCPIARRLAVSWVTALDVV